MKNKYGPSKRDKLTIWIGHRLRKARMEKGMPQSKVGSFSIVSQSELSKIEAGNRRIDFLVILQLAKAYGKDLRYFVPENYETLFSRENELKAFVERTGPKPP